MLCAEVFGSQKEVPDFPAGMCGICKIYPRKCRSVRHRPQQDIRTRILRGRTPCGKHGKSLVEQCSDRNSRLRCRNAQGQRLDTLLSRYPFRSRADARGLYRQSSRTQERSRASGVCIYGKRVSDKTPPTFLWHCADDGSVPVENSLFYASSLSKHKIPFEMHIYPWGGHGLSLADRSTASGDWHIVPKAAEWVGECLSWMETV